MREPDPVRIRNIIYVAMLTMLASTFCEADADSLFSEDAGYSGGSNIEIFTDRSLYMASENIYFRIHLQNFDSIHSTRTIFYIELIDPAGNSIAQKKILLDSLHSNGYLTIPKGISSGVYYLKGYTKWMRNLGPQNFKYVTVEIIDPTVSRMIAVDTTKEFSNNFREMKIETGDEPLFMNGLDELVARRSEVHFELSLGDSFESADFCLSVIPEQTLREQSVWMPPENKNGSYEFKFIGESDGVSLSGRVVFADKMSPADYAMLYITFLDESRAFYCNYADSAGKFYFNFNEIYGERPLFISANHSDTAKPELFIDRDFDAEPIDLPSFSIQSVESRREVISELSLNAQISSQYYENPGDSSQRENNGFLPFYGKASSVIFFKDFIRLPNLEEYFFELIPQVRILKSHGEKIFRVLGDHQDLKLYEPLVLIDGVAIFDIETVLSVPPGYIDHIEIIDYPYIRGNLTFGGIISIFSRNNDMGFVDLPASGLLLNYRMIGHSDLKPQDFAPEQPNLPDSRNTLYWEPQLFINRGEKKKIGFTTGDTRGAYEVVLRGYTSEGEYFSIKEKFNVR